MESCDFYPYCWTFLLNHQYQGGYEYNCQCCNTTKYNWIALCTQFPGFTLLCEGKMHTLDKQFQSSKAFVQDWQHDILALCARNAVSSVRTLLMVSSLKCSYIYPLISNVNVSGPMESDGIYFISNKPYIPALLLLSLLLLIKMSVWTLPNKLIQPCP